MPRDFNRLDESSIPEGPAARMHPQLQGDLNIAGGSPIRIGRRGIFKADPTDAAAAKAPRPAAPAKPVPRSNRRRLVVTGIALAAAVLGGWYGYHWWTVGRFTVSTDDAYVSAKTATL